MRRVGRLFINPGDRVLTGCPTYLGAIQAQRIYNARSVTVPIDDDGMRFGRFERALESGPVRFVYVLPNFHNRAGTTMSFAR